MMFIKDLDNRMVMANRRYEEFHGVQVDDVMGKTCTDWLPADIAQQFAHHDRQVVEAGQSGSVELRVPRADGATRTMKEKKFLILDAKREIVGLGCVSTDITAIKDQEKISRKAEAKAQRAQAQLSAFMDHSPAGMYLKDRDLRVTMVNRACEKLYGLDESELVGYRTVPSGRYQPVQKTGRKRTRRSIDQGPAAPPRRGTGNTVGTVRRRHDIDHLARRPQAGCDCGPRYAVTYSAASAASGCDTGSRIVTNSSAAVG